MKGKRTKERNGMDIDQLRYSWNWLSLCLSLSFSFLFSLSLSLSYISSPTSRGYM